MHGIYRQPSLDHVADKISDNIRIIDETLTDKKNWVDGWARTFYSVDLPVQIKIGHGACDDFFGISYDLHISGEHTRISKVSILLDSSNKAAYVVTFQGPHTRASDVTEQDNIDRLHNLTEWLATDPRTFTLNFIKKELRAKGFQRLYAIKPTEHLYMLEEHEGFTGRYLPQLLKSGLDLHKDCYLYCDL